MELTQFLLQQAQALQKQLHQLLEKADSTMPTVDLPFEVTTDLSKINQIGEFLPQDLSSRVPIVFTRLHPYFDAGVLFKARGNSWCPQWAFQKGSCFQLSKQETEIEFEFPELKLTEVKRAKSQAVINDLGLEEYLNNDKISALVFRPHPDFLFLVLSELADPWLKLQIDKTQTKALNLLADYF